MPRRHDPPAPRPARPWCHPWVRHLRLHFNVLLSPIYLYGVLLGSRESPGEAALGDPDVALGWLALHVFLYGGATAFNSYYDRDEGPIGGMLHPPAVDRGLLPFSLAVQAAGLPVALWIGPAFAGAWAALALLFTAYSHPTVRLKAHPVAALAAIALGQGAIGFAAGWLVVAPAGSLASAGAAWGMAATALVVTGLYLVSQSYQTREDRARGDRTLPVLLGPARALALAVTVLAPGGARVVADVHRIAGAGAAVPLAAFFALLGVATLAWAARFDEEAVTANYRRAMALTTLAGVGLSAALVALLAGVGVANAPQGGAGVL